MAIYDYIIYNGCNKFHAARGHPGASKLLRDEGTQILRCVASFCSVVHNGKPRKEVREEWMSMVYISDWLCFWRLCSIMFYQDREERVSIFTFSAQFWPMGGSTAWTKKKGCISSPLLASPQKPRESAVPMLPIRLDLRFCVEFFMKNHVYRWQSCCLLWKGPSGNTAYWEWEQSWVLENACSMKSKRSAVPACISLNASTTRTFQGQQCSPSETQLMLNLDELFYSKSVLQGALNGSTDSQDLSLSQACRDTNMS